MTDESAPSVLGPLARLSDGDIIRLLFTQADQLSMEFAREVVSRGERILPRLAEVARFPCNWHKSDAGWCAVVHAVFLMGAIGGEAAVEPLLDALRLAEEFENSLAIEALPPIFGSLGPRTLPALRAVALDPGSEWMLRHTALAAMAAVALRNPETDAEVFGFIGRIAADDKEDKDLRALAGMILLHCSRREHEALLRGLADSRIAKGLYDKGDIRKGMRIPHVVHYRFDWMEFYHPDRILERRRRSERGRLSERQAEWPWMRALAAFVREGPSLEAERLMREALGRNRHLPDYLLGRKDLPEKLPRAVTPGCRDEAQLCAPALHIAWERVPGALRWLAGDHGLPESGKVGRNEPCPCGSGKKFKKCCLDRAAGHA